jgi:DNA-binding NtrC family response regulator
MGTLMIEAPTYLVTDDDPDTLRILARILESAGARVLTAGSGKEALKALDQEPVHLLLTDLIMPGMDGLALTKAAKAKNPDLPVIMVTAYASIETAVEAMKAGASDYITKPVIPEELAIKVAKALEHFSLQEEVRDLKERLSLTARPPDIIGESPRMKEVLRLIALVAKRDVPVVLTGESGTGKEVMARAIHSLSLRSSGPYVPINCGALPETLLESELFGYMKGAFTGAASAKKGLLEEASGGTLFLDEIGDAPLPIQMKLLRALQDGTIRRLGSTQTIRVDVRVVVATNRSLEREIAAGRFREDLYYRLSVVTIPLPPLRERREDIPLLVDHFIKAYRETINPAVEGITPEAQRKLLSHSWPGNVRELENLIRRALVLCRGSLIGSDDVIHLGAEVRERAAEGPGDEGLAGAQRRFLRAYFLEQLERRKGNVKQVAEDARVSRKNVYEYLKRLDIDPAAFRGKA